MTARIVLWLITIATIWLTATAAIAWWLNHILHKMGQQLANEIETFLKKENPQ